MITLPGLTPFTLELSAAFYTAAGALYGPWAFDPPTAELELRGVLVAPLGWADCERLAGADPDAVRWLESLRADVAARLAMREAWGE